MDWSQFSIYIQNQLNNIPKEGVKIYKNKLNKKIKLKSKADLI